MEKMSDEAWVVCIAMDAFRLCIGMKPRNFTREEVIRWISALSSEGA